MKLTKNKSIKSKVLLTALLFAVSPFAKALSVKAEEPVATMQGIDIALWATFAILLFILFVLIYFLSTFKTFLGAVKTNSVVVQDTEWSFNNAVPIEREEEIMLDHEYDGIRELDNNLPAWWVYMFYLTILFSGVYLAYYHFLGGNLQEAEYKEEIAIAEKHKASLANSINEANVTVLTDEARLANGKTLYSQYCGACHGKSGEGGVGPNLTDEYWLHGGNIKDVFKTITNGVPQKGMISWKAQLSPAQIQEVSSYILSLKGSNPANAKEPQGDLYKE